MPDKIYWEIAPEKDEKQFFVMTSKEFGEYDVLGTAEWHDENGADAEEAMRQECLDNVRFVVAAYNTCRNINDTDPKKVLDYMPMAIDALGKILNSDGNPTEMIEIYKQAHTAMKNINPNFKEKIPLIHLLADR